MVTRWEQHTKLFYDGRWEMATTLGLFDERLPTGYGGLRDKGARGVI